MYMSGPPNATPKKGMKLKMAPTTSRVIPSPSVCMGPTWPTWGVFFVAEAAMRLVAPCPPRQYGQLHE